MKDKQYFLASFSTGEVVSLSYRSLYFYSFNARRIIDAIKLSKRSIARGRQPSIDHSQRRSRLIVGYEMTCIVDDDKGEVAVMTVVAGFAC